VSDEAEGLETATGAPRTDAPARPAFYAARPGRWWTLLHPPYTAWHLAYVVIGAALAPRVEISRLLASVLAFFLAVGVAAHALDELHGRPLATSIPGAQLVAAVVVGLAGAVTLGVLGTERVGWVLIPFMVLGAAVVVGYNLELFGGVVHNDAGFAASWGAFPVLVGYVAESGRLSVGAGLAALGAFALSVAQRHLSSQARLVRRRSTDVTGRITLLDGSALAIDRASLLAPIEGALAAMSWAIVLLAAGLAVARLA
jgi:hypothetical protein